MHMKDDKVHLCQKRLTDHTGHACEICCQGFAQASDAGECSTPGRLWGLCPSQLPLPVTPRTIGGSLSLHCSDVEQGWWG